MSSPLTVENFSSVFRGELDSQLRTGALKRKFDDVDTKIQQVARVTASPNAASYQIQQSLNSLSAKIDGNQFALQAQLADVSRKVDTLSSQTLQQFDDVEDRSSRRGVKITESVEDLITSVQKMTQEAVKSLSKTNQLGEELKSVKEELSTKIDTNQAAVMDVLAQMMQKLSS